MEINYPLISLVVLAAVALLIFIMRRNKRDRKDFEKESNQAEIKPEQHDKQADADL